MKKKGFKNKRILITAGPTWVPIDGVRVIANIATGRTGTLLAEKLQKLGARVTLLLGPVPAAKAGLLNKKIRLIPFRFFAELKDLVIGELKRNKYDAVIHSAAVADYRLKRTYSNKISSGIKRLTFTLTPTPKIIDLIRKSGRTLLLVGFKFEPQAQGRTLITKGKRLLKGRLCDLVVANTLIGGRYKAYIIKKDGVSGPVFKKEQLVKDLVDNL